MRIVEGQPAPHFSTTSAQGNPIQLEQYRGQPLWLVLSRWANCPYCSLRLDRVGRGFDAVKRAGVAMLVIFPSPAERIQRYVEKYAPPFDVASDPEHEVFKLYGSETSWSGELKTVFNASKTVSAMRAARLNPLAIDGAVHRMPSDFLIDEGGVLRRVCYGEELDDGFAVAEVVAWAGELKSS